MLFLFQATGGTPSPFLLASPIIALLALFVSITSAIVGFKTLKMQHKHNVLMVKPIASIEISDYENSLSVYIRNNGTGPMIINSVTVSSGSETKNNLIDWMQDLPVKPVWDFFVTDTAGRSLTSGDEILLLSLKGDDTDQNFVSIRDNCRRILRYLSIEVSYTDVYNTPMPIQKRKLSWFDRNL